MSDVLWNALLSFPNPGEKFANSFEKGLETRKADAKEAATREAIAGLSGPDPKASLQRLYKINPQLGMQMEDQLAQRGDRDRASAFREGTASMLLGGGANVLMPSMVMGGLATMAASPGGAAARAPDRAAAARAALERDPNNAAALRVLNNHDPDAAQAHVMGRLDPHRESIIKGAQIIDRMKPTDQASWDATRQAAGAAGLDLTDVPAHFDPSYVEQVKALAGHISQPQGEGAAASMPAGYEAAVRADPSAFLKFQGERIDLTKKGLEVTRDINNTAMQLLGGVSDQAGYDAAKARVAGIYAANGLDPASLGLPDEYSAQAVRTFQMQGMDTSKQLEAVARENRLGWDIADDQADNARADRQASSMEAYRTGQLANARRGQDLADSRGRRGQDLADSRGRRGQDLAASRPRSGSKGGKGDGDGPVAVGPGGQKIVVRGGKWVDAQTGKPVS